MNFLNILQVTAYLINILGFPLAIYVFIKEKKKERYDREYGTYNALDDKYIHYLELCFKHPDLDIFDIPLEDKAERSPVQERRERIVFTILISIMERAFLMYRDQSTRLKKRQWVGWAEYMKDWGKRANFQKEWKNLGYQFDEDFVNYMNKMMLVP